MTVPAQDGRLTARHATLEDLAVLLREQQARKVDVVAAPQALRARDGMLVISGTEPVLLDGALPASAFSVGDTSPADFALVGSPDIGARKLPRALCGAG